MFDKVGAAQPPQHEGKLNLVLKFDKKPESTEGQACLSGHQAAHLQAPSSVPPSLSGRPDSPPPSGWEFYEPGPSRELTTRHCRSSSPDEAPGTGEVVTAPGNEAEGKSDSVLSSDSEDSIVVVSMPEGTPTLGSESQTLGSESQNSGSVPQSPEPVYPAEDSLEHLPSVSSIHSSFSIIPDE
ncbi:hypothetical protein [Endozoicomonas sp.]|uniref:hypothetical protein n=1 Tax=Endozoicomonas sp. TaxID=1892382 RepID=UPI003AF72FBF